jgi:hypothetical protein
MVFVLETPVARAGTEKTNRPGGSELKNCCDYGLKDQMTRSSVLIFSNIAGIPEAFF